MAYHGAAHGCGSAYGPTPCSARWTVPLPSFRTSRKGARYHRFRHRGGRAFSCSASKRHPDRRLGNMDRPFASGVPHVLSAFVPGEQMVWVHAQGVSHLWRPALAVLALGTRRTAVGLQAHTISNVDSSVAPCACRPHPDQQPIPGTGACAPQTSALT